MKWLTALGFLCLTHCASARMDWRPTPGHLKPTFVDHYEHYALGLWGQSEVDLASLCLDQPVRAAQIQHTPVDLLLSGLTLGVYTPVTVKVWCGP